MSVVKTRNSPRWKEITFQIFDVPSMGANPFEERMEYLKSTFNTAEVKAEIEHVVVVEQTKAESRDHVLSMLKDVEGKGGEGLMLRKPES